MWSDCPPQFKLLSRCVPVFEVVRTESRTARTNYVIFIFTRVTLWVIYIRPTLVGQSIDMDHFWHNLNLLVGHNWPTSIALPAYVGRVETFRQVYLKQRQYIHARYNCPKENTSQELRLPTKAKADEYYQLRYSAVSLRVTSRYFLCQ